MDNSESIISYLEGDLEGDELAAFEARLSAEPELAAELEEFKDLYGDLDDLRADNVARTDVLAALESRSETANEEEAAPILGRRMRWWALAASIVLLGVVGYLMAPQKDASYFQANYPGLYQGGGPARSITGDGEKEFTFALGIYEEGIYEAALAAFNEVPLVESGAGEVILYKSSCLLQLKRPKEALVLTTSLLSDPVYGEYAIWYTALANLHLGQVDAAKGYLEEMAQEPGDFKDEAAIQILKKLKWGF